MGFEKLKRVRTLIYVDAIFSWKDVDGGIKSLRAVML